MDALITVDMLTQLNGHVVLIDASMPRTQRFIKGAQCFDVDEVADHTSPYPHMLPSAEDFEAYVRPFGIHNDTDVVVCDSTGVSFAAARVWWMFRVFGHENVRVLNGGLPAWVMQGGNTQTTPAPSAGAGTFTAQFNPTLYRSYEDMVRISEDGSEQIIDVRGAGRFNAMVRTMDGDVIPAHIEGSVNLPFAAILDPMGGTMLPAPMIAQVIDTYLPATDKKRVVSCASGITACVMALAFFQSGERDVAVFDGSWIEWSDKQTIR